MSSESYAERYDRLMARARFRGIEPPEAVTIDVACEELARRLGAPTPERVHLLDLPLENILTPL